MSVDLVAGNASSADGAVIVRNRENRGTKPPKLPNKVGVAGLLHQKKKASSYISNHCNIQKEHFQRGNHDSKRITRAKHRSIGGYRT
ncbi:MAG: hypothetical protein ACLTUA_10315 [Bifidobacterium pseudocatenulatum]